MDYQLDLTAYRCPLPLLMTKKALAELAKGDTLTVHLAEGSNLADFRLLCEQKGYVLKQEFSSQDSNKRSILRIFLPKCKECKE